MSTLGQSGQTAYPLYDARLLREHRRRFARPEVPELRLANSFYCPSGVYPSRGWVLLRRADYLKLDTYANDFVLTLDDMQSDPLVLKGLFVVQARCVTSGYAQHDDSIYLVELTDSRGVLANRWFEFPTVSGYNVLAPAYAADSGSTTQYYSETMDTGGTGPTAFTWDRMCRDLWLQMTTPVWTTALLGAYPGPLSPTPSGTPESWWFPGMGAWPALNRILASQGYALAVNHTIAPSDTASPYSFAVLGGADDHFVATHLKYLAVMEEDMDWLDTGSGRVPAWVRVYFHRRYQYYGTEETVRRDAQQWATPSMYWVDVAAPPTFATAKGMGHLWTDISVRQDTDGSVLAADVAMALNVAQNETTNFFARIYRQTAGYLHQWFTGIVPFRPGAQLDGVAWRHDYSMGRRAWFTECIRGPQPPWPDIT